MALRNTSSTKNGDRLTRFVLTLNNYTTPEYEELQTVLETISRWAILGKEVGDSGTPHIQGACCLNKQIAFSTLKRMIPRAHIEKMRGEPIDSQLYCSKEDTNPWQCGTMPEPGKRSDILIAFEAIKDGATLRQLAQTNGVAVIKFYKGLTVCRSLLQAPRDPSKPPKIFWLHGPTGTGKTKTSYEQLCEIYGVEDVLILPDSTLKWFDTYDAQRAVIFDDFRSKGTSFAFLLRVLDRYPLFVPFKGGFVNWSPEVIIVTTTRDIRSTFEQRNVHKPEDLRQLERRVSHVLEFPLRDGDCSVFHFRLQSECPPDIRGDIEMELDIPGGSLDLPRPRLDVVRQNACIGTNCDCSFCKFMRTQ